MAFSICYWANYTQGKTKLSRKSENALADDRVLKFLYDADLRHVESSVVKAVCLQLCVLTRVAQVKTATCRNL